MGGYLKHFKMKKLTKDILTMIYQFIFAAIVFWSVVFTNHFLNPISTPFVIVGLAVFIYQISNKPNLDEKSPISNLKNDSSPVSV